jgi:predicted nucleic acid-binding protein
VTGDTKHILPLKEFRGIKILTPSEFIKRFPTALP